ncbi:MAG: DUF3971 domain-containing protein [Lamprobacter sp.]|uniref:YhdP family phospholipid transporter n=1 Tax=Lamprobacter sp. TaxID=3100796 RepID=UPI002B259AFB|nr:AsmA-like C-terminal region-containing protein [Lamprobacter sp.]MEA3638724.1 DUF3971 domain-containing protein [Lamprobacter sp.]
MTRILQRLLSTTLAGLATTIILLALLSILARLLLPHADRVRETLIGRIGDNLGVAVEVGALSIQLRGLMPRLSFADARLLAPADSHSHSHSTTQNQTLLAARTLTLDLDLLATLRARGARIAAISLVGAELQVLRDANGRLRLRGLDSMRGNDAQALDFFLREGRFRLLDSTLSWRDQGSETPARSLFIEIAELTNQDQQHNLRLRAFEVDTPVLDSLVLDSFALNPFALNPPAPDATAHRKLGQAVRLEILGELEGPPGHPERWSGRLYLNAEGDDLGLAAAGLLPVQWRLKTSRFRMESWNQLEQGRLMTSWTRFNVDGLGTDRLSLHNDQQGRAVKLGDLAGFAHWQRQVQGWRLDLSDLKLPFGNRIGLTPTRASLSARNAVTPIQTQTPESTGINATSPSPSLDLFAAIGTLDLGPIAEAIATLVPDLPDPIKALAQGRLQGLGRNLAVHLQLRPKAPISLAGTSLLAEQSSDHRIAPSASSHTGTSDSGQPPRHPSSRHPKQVETNWSSLRISDWRLSAEIEDFRIAPEIASEIAPDPSLDPMPDPSLNPSPETSTGTAIPALSGLDIGIDLGPQGGYAHLSGSNVRLDLRPLFAQPQAFTHVDGQFAWRRMPAGSIHLWTQAFSANTQHFDSLSRLSLCLHPSGVNPFLDLHTHFRNGSIAALPQWLPVGIMDDSLEDWLLRAIVDGRLESGDLLLRGPLERFPFDAQEGRFLLVLRAVDGVLDYGEAAQPTGSTVGLRSAEQTPPLSWPPLQQLAATLRFENRSLEIDVPSAEILNSRIDAGRVSLSNLWQPSYLEIDARGEGPLADGMHVLATSPLAHQLGGLASAVEVSGSGGLQLQLGVPLNKTLPFRYAGELLWDASADQDEGIEDRGLSINGTELRFDQIAGRLRFDETGIEGDSIQARLGKQRLDIAVKTLDSGTDDGRTQIDLRGRTAVERLAESLPSSLWSLVSGRLDWRLGLTLNNRDAAQPKPPIDFTFSSDLQGVTLSLPDPIGKPTSEQRNLTLSGRFQDQWPLNLQLEYGSLGGLLEIDRQPDGSILLPRLAIDLNGQPTTLPRVGSIQIGGALERLALDPWLSWLSEADLKALQGDPDHAGLRLLPLQLRVEALDVGALRLNAVEAVLTPQTAGAWDIGFSAEQTGDSQIRLPARRADDAQPLQIRLEQLDLEPIFADLDAGQDAEQDSVQDAVSTEPKRLSRADPRAFGRLDLQIAQLRYGKDLLGRLHIQSQPTLNGVRFETLSLSGPHVEATGSGDWLIDATDYIESSLKLSADSNAIGELLRDTGFYSALSAAPGELQLALSWPGGPDAFSLARARGLIEIQIGSGRMLDMEPGVGRMLGILNTSALSRRLSLDFSDVFDDGFSFDRINGEITIGSGIASIRELSILAPPADIRITGRTNLVDGLLDQQVEVTPKIGVGLALASAMAGGPVVGAAVFLADKVTDGAVERLGRYAYQVSGPWRDPVIQRMDTVGSPSIGNLFVEDPSTADDPSAINAQQDKAKEAAPSSPENPISPFLDDH